MKILLKQHVGAPCQPIVEIGEQVQRGQLIARPSGLGVNIHASLTGAVKDITPNYIEIADYDLNESDDHYVRLDEKLSPWELIKEAGVVGAGGAGFPTAVKYQRPFTDEEEGKVIVNAAECEPILQHNIALIEKDFASILRGLKHLMKIVNAKTGYIATKHKYMKAFLTIKKALNDEPNIQLFDLPNMYPAGDERVLIREIVGVELQPGELPLKAKAIVSNVETIKNVARAIEEFRPVITKDLTVGGYVKEHQNGIPFFDVPIGLPATYLLDQVHGAVDSSGPLYIGGPFTGKIGKMETPVCKTTGGFLIATPFFNFPNEKFGLIGCECGASLEELEELAQMMGGEVVAAKNCKRMQPDATGRLRCTLPGICPGQAPTVIELKKQGATAILIGTCESRTNTVAKVTPNMGLKLIHKTDFVLRAAGHRLYRRIED